MKYFILRVSSEGVFYYCKGNMFIKSGDDDAVNSTKFFKNKKLCENTVFALEKKYQDCKFIITQILS